VTPTRQGSVQIFRFAGIRVFLHWSWFVVAIFSIRNRTGEYGSMFWNAIEYLALFLIVLLHEFGHAFACRQVGGTADQIVLWPLGGVAYVLPPSRPGAMLWSIAAGPLVNVMLVPVLSLILILSRFAGWPESLPDVYDLMRNTWFINLAILFFNLLPIYPLDGGQILRSLLWFPLGRARSLQVAALIGFVGVAGIVALAFWLRSMWIGIMAVFVFLNCRGGLLQARALARAESGLRDKE
jgi:Zn-dependent protease